MTSAEAIFRGFVAEMRKQGEKWQDSNSDPYEARQRLWELLDAALDGWEAAEERNESPGVTVSGRLVAERNAALQEVERLQRSADLWQEDCRLATVEVERLNKRVGEVQDNLVVSLQEVERLKDELDGVRKRASSYREQIEIKQDDIKRLQAACATESHTSAWLRERIQHYEKSLREIAAVSSTQGWRKSVDIARAALSGSEPPSIPGFGDGMHGEDR